MRARRAFSGGVRAGDSKTFDDLVALGESPASLAASASMVQDSGRSKESYVYCSNSVPLSASKQSQESPPDDGVDKIGIIEPSIAHGDIVSAS